MNIKLLPNLFFIILILLSSGAKAYNMYEVNNVYISAKAENTTKAREIAIEQGQIEAFKVLTTKLGDSSIINPDINEISTIVRAFTINKEKMSPGNYTGIMNVSFSKAHFEKYLTKHSKNNSSFDKIETFLKVSNNKQTQNQYKKILVLPMFKKNGEYAIWEEDNAWLLAWKDNITSRLSTSEYVVAIGDLEDIKLTSGFNIMTANINSFHKIMHRYKTSEVIIVASNLNKNETTNSYDMEVLIKTHKDIVNNKEPFDFGHFQNENPDILYKEAIYKILEGNNKIASKTKSSKPEEIKLSLISNANFQDWTEIQKKLNNSAQFNKFIVTKMSLGHIYFDLYYKCEPENLINELNNIGLNITKKDDLTFLTLYSK